MITAVDTNVLLDLFTDNPQFRDRSRNAIRQSLADGPLVACDVVWAEVTAAFADVSLANRAMSAIPVAYSALDAESAARAGNAWRSYRLRGGRRDRLIPDFLIGAHAVEQADRLLTRDRGFHKAAFGSLVVVDPSA
jgi:hypothetical protein